MGLLAMLIAKLLDPVSFVVVLVVTFFSREKWIIPIAAVVGAVAAETVLTAAQITRSWGEGIIFSLIASGVHAVICYRLVGIKRKPKTKEAVIK